MDQNHLLALIEQTAWGGLRVHACVFVCEYHHSEGTCRGQERVSDPLELDFQGQLLGVLGMKLMSYG